MKPKLFTAACRLLLGLTLLPLVFTTRLEAADVLALKGVVGGNESMEK